jgi:hypothetical protein
MVAMYMLNGEVHVEIAAQGQCAKTLIDDVVLMKQFMGHVNVEARHRTANRENE